MINLFSHSCIDELKSAQLKVTPARLAVLKFLEKTSRPADVATITDHLRISHLGVDQATIFRTINSFTEKGLTQKIQLQEGKFRYEVTSSDHHHLICTSCGAIEDVADCGVDKLVMEIENKKGFQVKSHSLEFFGICQKCQP